MDNLTRQLVSILGSEHVTTDPLEREYVSQDVYSAGTLAAVVVAPGDKNELAAVVEATTGAGTAVVARGGGMSYTGGYLPVEDPTVMVDMRRMNRVLELNDEDMYITVEGGATWAGMNEALSVRGLRTPYWGPLSGRYATVGGSLSQNSIFFGSGRHGSSADSVIGMEVVLADGRILSTGAAAQVNAPPFFRHYGPDLTGLFTGDCGALGFKATATLRLMPELEIRAFGSFAFEDCSDALAAMSDIARANIVTECFGFDPNLQRQRMKKESLSSDLRKMSGVMKSAGGMGRAIRDGARIAAAGRRFMADVPWSVHVMIEERTEACAKACLDQVRSIATRYHGSELADSIPRLVRANPFGPVNNMLGPEGERWMPLHGLVPHSKAKETLSRIEAVFERERAELSAQDIRVGYLLATVSTHCVVIEPMLFWPGGWLEIHRRSVEPEHLKRLKPLPENAAASEAVAGLRSELMEVFRAAGAVHLQIGKAYPYRQGLRPEPFELVQALKRQLDPERRINPGILGL